MSIRRVAGLALGCALLTCMALLQPSVALATDGNVFAKGVYFSAMTYSGHPSRIGTPIDLNGATATSPYTDDYRWPLYAPEGGSVSIYTTGYGGGWGNSITWTSASGSERLFMAHLDQIVKTGVVNSGDLIGYLGSTGNSTGPHLHIERSVNGARADLVLGGQTISPYIYPSARVYLSQGPTSGDPPPVTSGWIASAVVIGNAPGSAATGSQGWTPVSFSVTAGNWTVNVRENADINSRIVGTLSANAVVQCYGWVHGSIVNDAWYGTPDARWYRVGSAYVPPAIPAKLEPVGPVALSPAAPYYTGQKITATFTVKNTGGQSGTWDGVILAVRGPSGENRDMGVLESLTLAPGELKTYTVSRTVDLVGSWSGWIAARTGGSTWSVVGTNPSVSFAVKPRVATKITAVGPSTVSYKAAFAFSGKLTTLGGTAISGRLVKLQRSFDGVAWMTVNQTTTDGAGAYSVSTSGTRSGRYRVIYQGETVFQPATGASTPVGIRVYLTAPTPPLTVLKGVAFAAAGYLKPKHPAGNYPIKIYCYRSEKQSDGTTKWVLRKTASALSEDYETYTRYSTALSLPYAGSWRMRAYHPEDDYNAATYSSWCYIKVE